MNSIIKRLGKICLGLGVMLVPVLGFGYSPQDAANTKREFVDVAAKKLRAAGVDSATVNDWQQSHYDKIGARAQKETDRFTNPANVMMALQGGAFKNDDGTLNKDELKGAIKMQAVYLKQDTSKLRDARKGMKGNRLLKAKAVKRMKSN